MRVFVGFADLESICFCESLGGRLRLIESYWLRSAGRSVSLERVGGPPAVHWFLHRPSRHQPPDFVSDWKEVSEAVIWVIASLYVKNNLSSEHCTKRVIIYYGKLATTNKTPKEDEKNPRTLPNLSE